MQVLHAQKIEIIYLTLVLVLEAEGASFVHRTTKLSIG